MLSTAFTGVRTGYSLGARVPAVAPLVEAVQGLAGVEAGAGRLVRELVQVEARLQRHGLRGPQAEAGVARGRARVELLEQVAGGRGCGGCGGRVRHLTGAELLGLGQVSGHGGLQLPHAARALLWGRGGGGARGGRGGGGRAAGARPGGGGRVLAQSMVGGLHRCLQHGGLYPRVSTRAVNEGSRSFHMRTFSLLKAPTSAFTIKNLYTELSSCLNTVSK